MRMLRFALASWFVIACSTEAPSPPKTAPSKAGSAAEIVDIVSAIRSELDSYDRAAMHLGEEANAIDDHLATAKTDADRAAIKTALAYTADERTHLRRGMA